MPAITIYGCLLCLAHMVQSGIPKKDIDLGYLSKLSYSLKREINLLRDLIFCFKKDRIDLVNLDKANPLLLYEAASQGRVLYGSEEDFLRFKIKAFARYTETKFLREKRREYLLNLP